MRRNLRRRRLDDPFDVSIEPDDIEITDSGPRLQTSPSVPDRPHPVPFGDAGDDDDDSLAVCWVCEIYFEDKTYDYCPHCRSDLVEVEPA